MNDSNFLVFACYLPPENSSRGRDAPSFFAHLLAQIYLNDDCDAILLTGDFNLRIGSLPDTLNDIDCVPMRNTIDKSINQHGHEFIDFLNESKFCVLNGRFQDCDNFTSISKRGKSVVDYICVPHDVFDKCKKFEVLTAESIVNNNSLFGLLGGKSRLPDHSVLITEFTVTHFEQAVSTDNEMKRARFKINQIPLDFMSSEIRRNALINIITDIEHSRETQENIDVIYENLCTEIIAEMTDKIPQYCNYNSKKHFRTKKLYWNETLTELWNKMRTCEKDFVKYSGRRNIKTTLRNNFMQTRNCFDKNLRRAERTYRRTVAIEIETMTSKNPTDFWEKIRKLGPRSNKCIPQEVVDDNGTITRSEQEVLERWRSDFENLYNGLSSDEFDSEHYIQAKVRKNLLEENMEDPLFMPNNILNVNISRNEINSIVMQAKLRSASGYDEIPYDVLKFPVVIEILHNLFQLIFDSSLIPSAWRKSIICPILKDPSSDARIPMNYRGVSLLSCMNRMGSGKIGLVKIIFLP
ncbi:Hypothetical predicted protein [Mytilus galloprovincialis]|uniref:Endonuclease/exonuclease/phosphatase domain-containing protein n=1 Tax=Mytilus galloprovincialis TaxID=29158 RepID=A0A8B6G7S5_MYTGA|nr:Hypothetical predicted protein [Mytilus galloprovincialis]